MSREIRISWTGHSAEEMIETAAKVGVTINVINQEARTVKTGRRICGRFEPNGTMTYPAVTYYTVDNSTDFETATAAFEHTDKMATEVIRQAELSTGKRVEWTKVDGRWVIVGSDLVEGAEVTVTRANGTQSLETVKRIVGERDGLSLAEVY